MFSRAFINKPGRCHSSGLRRGITFGGCLGTAASLLPSSARWLPGISVAAHERCRRSGVLLGGTELLGSSQPPRRPGWANLPRNYTYANFRASVPELAIRGLLDRPPRAPPPWWRRHLPPHGVRVAPYVRKGSRPAAVSASRCSLLGSSTVMGGRGLVRRRSSATGRPCWRIGTPGCSRRTCCGRTRPDCSGPGSSGARGSACSEPT
jgi:hypothetical protein